MAPLSSQTGFHHTGFVVPELVTQTAAKTPVTEESLDQDRGTDISGTLSPSSFHTTTDIDQPGVFSPVWDVMG